MSAPHTVPPLPTPGTPFSALPAALAPLQAEERWLVWRWEPHWKSGKLTKVPYVADGSGRMARSNGPKTWRPFADALAAYATGRFHGIGFMLAGSRYGAFDLDDCRDPVTGEVEDPVTGEVEEWALAKVQDAASYAEVTISGTGLRIIGLASGSKVHRNQAVPETNGGRLETYRGCERYVVVTGDHLPGAPETLAEIDAEIDATVAWLDEMAAAAKAARRGGRTAGRASDRGDAHDTSDGRRRMILPPELERLIRDGAPEGRRSDEFMHVVGWLKDYGWSASEITALLSRFPDGIAEKYQDRFEAEVQRCWDKVEAKPRRERAGRRGRSRRRTSGDESSDEGWAPGADPQEGERPIVRIVAGQVPRAVDETEAALIAAGAPIYSRAGSLVRPVTETAPAAGEGTTLITRFRAMCPASMADHAARAADFQRFDMRSEDWVNINPPGEVVAALLARDGEWRLPSVAGIVTTPTLRPDGSVLVQPGYDPATRLLLMLAPDFALPTILERPNRADAARALRFLSDLLDGFPFVTEVDRAVALSGILTAVARGALPVTPLHAVNAHTPGTGKSYLVDVVSAIATGRRCPVIAAGKTEEETEKRLGAMLREAVPVVSIDNVNGELGGDMLCQMTERPLVRVRILGKSETPEMECRSTVFATGNNLTLVGDMTRRAVICAMDAGLERPELREFAFDPVKRVLADRGAYVAAALTIVLAYRAAGSPAVCGPIGSYGAWSEMVRAPLIWLGEADPIVSMEAAREEDPELSAIRELFEHWRQHPLLHLHSPYSVNGIIQVACEQTDEHGTGREFRSPEFRDLLLRRAGRGGAVNSAELGRWFRTIGGRVVDGYKLDIKVDEKRGNKYSLCYIDRAADAHDRSYAHAAE